jgi:hypothetical protein
LIKKYCLETVKTDAQFQFIEDGNAHELQSYSSAQMNLPDFKFDSPNADLLGELLIS